MDWIELLGWNETQLDELRFTGFSFLREGKYEKALLFFEGLVTLAPTSAYDLQTLGGLYLQMGRKEEALLTLNRALDIEPNHEPTLLNKAKTLVMLDKKIEAFQLFRVLEKSKDPAISQDASALILAYR